MNATRETSSVIISHESALRGMRYARYHLGCLPWDSVSVAEQRRVLSTCTCSVRQIDVGALVRRGFYEDGHPIDCLVTARSRQHTTSAIRSHLAKGNLPKNSLLKVAPGIYVVTPELLFAQLAATRPFTELVALAYELCGGFSLSELKTEPWTPTSANPEPGYHEAEPATNHDKLVKTCSKLTTMRGIPAARKAAAYALDGARSPSEAIVAGCYHLPMRYGGFGIENMRLNHRVDFTDAARSASGMPYAVLDAYVPEASSTLEYNGSDHDRNGRRIHDERRTVGLAVMGITTYPINYETLRDIEALETIAIDLYKRAGKRYRNRTTGYRVKQIELLNGLRQAFGLKPC